MISTGSSSRTCRSNYSTRSSSSAAGPVRSRSSVSSSGRPLILSPCSMRSFGFEHGLPLAVDLVMDVRFLPNPHWVHELRPMTGFDAPVREYMLGQPATKEFLVRFEHLLELLLPACEHEGKSYLSLAIGCTG